MEVSVPRELELDWRSVLDFLEEWVKKYFSESRKEKAIVGISGGVDSTTLAFFLTKALGPKRVLCVSLPESGVTPKCDRTDVRKVCESLGVEMLEMEISSLVKGFLRILPKELRAHRIAYGNLKPRIRMTILYAVANLSDGIVFGSGDRSEYYLGYFTKYGDGAADVFPFLSLYKTQVKKLGEILGVPKRILAKPPSPRLWKGHLAEKELGASYEVIDRVLFYAKDYPVLTGRVLSDKEISRRVNVGLEVVEMIRRREMETMHKRALPPSPQVSYKYFKFVEKG